MWKFYTNHNAKKSSNFTCDTLLYKLNLSSLYYKVYSINLWRLFCSTLFYLSIYSKSLNFVYTLFDTFSPPMFAGRTTLICMRHSDGQTRLPIFNLFSSSQSAFDLCVHLKCGKINLRKQFIQTNKMSLTSIEICEKQANTICINADSYLAKTVVLVGLCRRFSNK